MERFSTPACEVFAAEHDGLVLDPKSWETHYLPPASWLVFESLQAAPRTLAEIVDILQAALDASDADGVEELATRLLGELRRQGLVISAESHAGEAR